MSSCSESAMVLSQGQAHAQVSMRQQLSAQRRHPPTLHRSYRARASRRGLRSRSCMRTRVSRSPRRRAAFSTSGSRSRACWPVLWAAGRSGDNPGCPSHYGARARRAPGHARSPHAQP
eukprot:2691734-Prymnesium_polylepis.1